MRPSLAYDATGRLWIAWEQSGELWGKDFGALKKKGIPLYGGGRTVGLKVLDASGKWFTPPDVASAVAAAGPLDVLVNGSVLPGHEHDWSRVLVAVEDVTQRSRAERRLIALQGRK